jgi:ABC-type transport system substrate-binding protein/class 3 adenylate cyclase
VREDPAPAPAVRTFLIADIRGYTAFTHARGDEAAARLAGRFAEVCRQLVDAHGGRVVELRGDEALCVFEAPRAALRCAVALQRRFADDTRADPALPLRVGMGLDAGEAVAVEGGFRGGALNLAARLCVIAKGGEVLLSEGVVLLARRLDELTYVDRGRVSLKGLGEPVRYYAARFDVDLPPESERGSSRRRGPAAVGALALVCALVVGGAVAATHRGGRTETLSANVVGELDGGGAVQAQVGLPGRPSGIAAGGGSVWVADEASGEVYQIAPRTHAIVDRVPARIAPSAVAVGGGRVWVADGGNDTVTWFSPAQPSPRSIRVGIGPSAIAYGAGAAWVVNTVDGTVQRIDPVTLRPSRPLPVGTQPTAVAVGGGSVWVAVAASDEVVRIDPGSPGRITARLPVGNAPAALAYGGGYVWVANSGDGTVTRIDPAGGPARVVTTGGDPEGIAFGDGGVWVADGRGQRVSRIDPARMTVISATAVGAEASGVAVAGGRVWVSALAGPATHRGGVLRVEFDESNSPDTLDPGLSFLASGWEILRMTNDGLVAYRASGGPQGAAIVPDLAQALPAVSPDGRTYTFQLRRGLVYSDGSPVRASDFVSAAVRQFRIRNGPGTQLTFADLVGAAACRRRPSTCTLRGGVDANNAAGTVTYHLTRPDPAFLKQLALPFGDAVPPGAPAPGRTTRIPATGPYMIRSFVPSGPHAGVVLARNPRFRPWSDAAQPAGFPAEVRVAFPVPDGREVSDVERGRTDVIVSPAPGRLRELVTRFPSLIHPNPFGNVFYLVLNTRVRPFTSTDARRAVAFAMDRGRIIRLLMGSPLAATPTCQILPPGLIGYKPFCPYTLHPGPGGTWTAPDVQAARRLVAASGTAGARVGVAPLQIPGGQATTRYLVSLLRSIGYRATVRPVPPGTSYYNFLNDSSDRVQAGIYGWFQDYADPYDYLSLFTCSSFHPRSAANFNASEYCDPAFDGLVRRALAAEAGGAADAPAAWQLADRRLTNRAPAVPVFNSIADDVVSSRVGDYEHNPEFGVILDQLWVR